MQIEIKPAKATKKEYAEQDFTLNALIGTQFTIEEKLGMTECPRIKKVPTKDQKKTYDVVALKVTDGTFSKDLRLFDNDWKTMCSALPDSLVSLQGVTLKPTRDPNNPLRIKFEYVGVYTQDLNGDKYNSGNPKSEKIAASMEEAPTEAGMQIKQLHQAILLNKQIGTKTDEAVVNRIADLIRPGDAKGLIDAAKRAGMIVESNGIFRAE